MYIASHVMFSVNIYCLIWEKKTCVVFQCAQLLNLEMAAVIQPFLLWMFSFLLWKISKLKSIENVCLCNTTKFNNVNIIPCLFLIFVTLNIVDRVKAPFVPISFYPFSILPIGNHYSELDVLFLYMFIYLFCISMYP